jgi:sugar (pentulose or hexulose) kinase
MTHIAVIDIGKTNAKLALVHAATLAEVEVLTRPNRVLPGPPWPQFDLAGHWAFLKAGLAQFQASHGVAAISVTTHGASAVGLDVTGAALPMLDYEYDFAEPGYEALRPDFAETGSPRLGMGLNLGAQLAWLATRPEWRPAHILTYPGYWGYLLTGEMSCDVTSLGCHTDLWAPREGRWSSLVERLGLGAVLAPARLPDEVLGQVSSALAAETGLARQTPVSVGIHDSNASLYPHVKARSGAFSVVSTGTWVVVMTMGGRQEALDPGRDTLINVNALGQPVPSARFMGGREYEILSAEGLAAPTAADRAAVLGGVQLLPAVEPGSGPFRGRQARWTHQPATAGQRALALSWYLALMTDTCLRLTGAEGAVIVEGPFARNADYLAMLASLRPVEVALSATGTSTGAALLCLASAPPPETRPIAPPADASDLRLYAALWQDLTRAPI